MSKKYIFIDLETTGLSPEKNDIVQMAAIKTDENFNIIDKKEIFWFSSQINDTFFHKSLNKKMSYAELTGLSAEFLKQNHLTQEQMQQMDDLLEINSIERKNITIVAYNAEFEQKWLTYKDGRFKDYQWKCLMKTYQNLKNRKAIKEMNMLEDLGVNFEESKLHNALYDISMCIEAAKVLKQKAENGEKIKENPELPTTAMVDYMNSLLNQQPKGLQDHVVKKLNEVPNAYTSYVVGSLISKLTGKPSDKEMFMDDLGFKWVQRLK